VLSSSARLGVPQQLVALWAGGLISEPGADTDLADCPRSKSSRRRGRHSYGWPR